MWKIMLSTAVFQLCLLVSIVLGLSFKGGTKSSKERYYNHLVSSKMRGKTFDGTEFQDCKDQLTLCKSYTKFCNFHRIVREHCPATCKMCKFPYPVSCTESKFGCCWDNVTIATGPDMKGCPECVDVHSDCRILLSFCSNVKVRRLCPVTCGVKCEQCSDDPHQKDECRFYQKLGFCSLDPKLMAEHCRKTCKFC